MRQREGRSKSREQERDALGRVAAFSDVVQFGIGSWKSGDDRVAQIWRQRL